MDEQGVEAASCVEMGATAVGICWKGCRSRGELTFIVLFEGEEKWKRKCINY